MKHCKANYAKLTYKTKNGKKKQNIVNAWQKQETKNGKKCK